MNDVEFDSLPYKHVKDALGCADKKAGVAYVRKTGIKPLDAYVTDHELDELVNKYSEHEDTDGIRYKKWGPTIAGLATSILGKSPVLGALAGGAYEGYRESQGTGITGNKAYGIPLAMIGGAMGGSGKYGAIGGGMMDAIGRYAYTKDTGEAMKAFAGRTLSNLAGQGISKVGAGAIQGATKAAPGIWSKIGGTVSGAAEGLGFGGGTNQVSGRTIPASTIGTAPGISRAVGPTAGFAVPGFNPGITGYGAPGAAGGLLRGFGAGTPASENIARLGLSLALGQFGPKAEPFQPFQDSDLVKEVLDRIRSGATAPMGEEQRNALTFQFDQQKDETIQAMKERFKALRPGSDVSNDSQFREILTEIESDFAEKKARAIAGAEIGLGQTQTEQLSQLAQLDVFTLARQASISVQEARQFQQMIAQLFGLQIGGNQDTTGDSGTASTGYRTETGPFYGYG